MIRPTFLFKKSGVFLVVTLMQLAAFAGKLEKGLEALKVFDYFKAKEYFEKAMKKDAAGASYGMSLIYGNDKNPFFQMDSAYAFIFRADTLFDKLEEDDRKEYTEIGIDKKAIRKQKQHVSNLFYKVILKKHTVEVYQDFLDSHPWANQKAEVIKRRNELAWNNALSTGEHKRIKQFMEKYPDAEEQQMAKEVYDSLFYYDFTKSGEIETYKKFIDGYEESSFVKNAQDKVFELSTKRGEVKSYTRFIKENPANRHIGEAWEVVYKTYTHTHTPEVLKEFMIEFPEYPDQKRVNIELELSQIKFYPFKSNGLWGYINREGQVLIEPQFSYADRFSEGKAAVGKGELIGYINKKGDQVIPYKLTDASTFKNGKAVVETDKGYGIIDYRNEFLLKPVYEEIGEYNSGLAYVFNGDKYGYVNEGCELSIPFMYSEAYDFKEGYAIVKVNGKWGIINTRNEFVIEAVFDWIDPEFEHEIRAKIGVRYGLININGDTLSSFDWDFLGPFKDNRSLAVSEDDHGYINRVGEVSIGLKFDYNETTLNRSDFENGYAKVLTKGKVGIIDTTGSKVFPAVFQEIGVYNPMGNTAVKKRGKWGYANTDVRLVIPYQYEFGYPFNNRVALVEKKGMYGVIDEKNKTILSYDFQKIERWNDTTFLVQVEDRYGVLNLKGDTVYQVKYDAINKVDSGFIEFVKKGKSAYYREDLKKFVLEDENWESDKKAE